MLKVKRVYEPREPSDGRRVLVERLWPRGLSKSALQVDEWLKDVGPSTGLRQWFGHDPGKWEEFRARYFRELDAKPEVWRPLIAGARRGPVTLVYSARDTEHNNAVALRDYLNARMRKRHDSHDGTGSGARRTGTSAAAEKLPRARRAVPRRAEHRRRRGNRTTADA